VLYAAIEATVDDLRGPLEFSVLAPWPDNELEDVGEVLWTHHVDRRVLQTRLGMP
jgi:hypothetical protein